MSKHSDASIERAAITLREITQELRGRGISAVMTLEEHIKDVEQQRDELLQALALLLLETEDDPRVLAQTKRMAAAAIRKATGEQP